MSVQALTPKPAVEGNLFSASDAFPVTFENSASENSSPMIEVMDLSAGDVVSVGGPKSCAWDGSSSSTQHRTPSFPRSSLEARFAAELEDDSTAQHEQLASLNSNEDSAAQRGQVSVTEQAAHTGFELPSEHSVQSRRTAARPATLDELAGLLLPQSCRVAARVSTKLPPLDHYPTLPPLPEGFILPPEMHPVVGSYTKTRIKTTSTGSQTAAAWSGTSDGAAAGVQNLVEDVSPVSHAQEGSAGAGKWVHPKQTPPAPKARWAPDLLPHQFEICQYFQVQLHHRLFVSSAMVCCQHTIQLEICFLLFILPATAVLRATCFKPA